MTQQKIGDFELGEGQSTANLSISERKSLLKKQKK
jgi:hypothetical protein